MYAFWRKTDTAHGLKVEFMREASLDFDLKGAHISVDWDASSKRPGFQSNLSAGTHMGVRNLAPTHVGSSKSYL